MTEDYRRAEESEPGQRWEHRTKRAKTLRQHRLDHRHGQFDDLGYAPEDATEFDAANRKVTRQPFECGGDRRAWRNNPFFRPVPCPIKRQKCQHKKSYYDRDDDAVGCWHRSLQPRGGAHSLWRQSTEQQRRDNLRSDAADNSTAGFAHRHCATELEDLPRGIANQHRCIQRLH